MQLQRTHLVLLTSLLLALWISPARGASVQQPIDESRWLDVEQGQSMIWKGERDISRVLISDPDIAEVKLLEQQQFQIRGIQEGSTDLWVWYRHDTANPVSYEVVVHQDLSELVRRVAGTVDGVPPRIFPLKGRIVLEGPVPDMETLERVAAIAKVFDPDFVNLMTIQGDHQVQLHVVFAEVSRAGARTLGINWMLMGSDLSVQQLASDRGDEFFYTNQDGETDYTYFPSTGTFQVAALANVSEYLVGALLAVLEERGLTKILAEPTLVALSGQQAEFVVGGEVPMAITTEDRIKIEFKEFGTKLVFVPTVLAEEVVDLRVYTEVSELDDNASVQAGGMSIPGFATRKGSSHLRLQNGTTFAMAGLLSEGTVYRRTSIPILGDIPIIGSLFRYVEHERQETEVIIFVTPRLVRPLAPGEVPAPPTASEDNNPNDFELFLLGMDRRIGSRSAEAAEPMGMER